MNTKLHAVTDANGKPVSLFMTAGQASDYAGAAALLDSLPRAQWLLGDRDYARTGSGAPCRPRGSRLASSGANPRPNPSATTHAATSGATASKSCSHSSEQHRKRWLVTRRLVTVPG